MFISYKHSCFGCMQAMMLLHLYWYRGPFYTSSLKSRENFLSLYIYIFSMAKIARLGVIIIRLLLILAGISEAPLPSCLSNFKVIGKSIPIYHGFETSRDLAARRLTTQWIEAWVIFMLVAVPLELDQAHQQTVGLIMCKRLITFFINISPSLLR